VFSIIKWFRRCTHFPLACSCILFSHTQYLWLACARTIHVVAWAPSLIMVAHMATDSLKYKWLRPSRRSARADLTSSSSSGGSDSDSSKSKSESKSKSKSKSNGNPEHHCNSQHVGAPGMLITLLWWARRGRCARGQGAHGTLIRKLWWLTPVGRGAHKSTNQYVYMLFPPLPTSQTLIMLMIQGEVQC
jgi:hypothetical protein